MRLVQRLCRLWRAAAKKWQLEAAPISSRCHFLHSHPFQIPHIDSSVCVETIGMIYCILLTGCVYELKLQLALENNVSVKMKSHR